MTDQPSSDTQRIRALNDQVRSAGPTQSAQARWLITAGVRALGDAATTAAVQAVRRFETFDANNDPHGEHDFGAFTIVGEQLFWKIDYYDHDLSAGSPDAADETLTCRVVTLLLASEY
ncbi:DUF3768 domain-containing protein [Phenylobacterium sp. LH3H17]|uniref:DUF3768 domain-containing protein n=1 Tax=Phenylobacterium sp. LH3H17 TaxID=2903901 RepID=UPI0020C9D52C|nr:DUF3768 domain-containing protein [Phenylobacterium sp. LH3H17]UTP39781.1 DUF3768 domain-containing protein [Phenylobacterium sp. LH3H17]